MSKVPEYGAPKVQANPLPGVRQQGRQAAPDAQALGGGIGDAIAQTGSALYGEQLRHQQEETLRQDQARVTGAEAQLSDWELKTIYDPKDGALAQTGTKAFELPDTVKQSWDDAVGSIREGLSTQRQKDAFDRAVVSKQESVFKTVKTHVMGQMRAVEKDNNDSYIANSLQLAVKNADDPVRISQEIDNTRIHAALAAQSQGMGPDATKAYVEVVTSNIHVGVLDQLLASGQDVKARNYFDAAKDEIDAKDLPRVERALEIGSTQGQAQRAARSIVGNWQAAPDSTTMEGGVVTLQLGRETTLQEALDKADNDPKLSNNPKLLDDVKQRIRQSYSDYKTTQNEAQQQAAQQTKQIMDQAKEEDEARKEQLAQMLANGIVANHVTDANLFSYVDKVAPGVRATWDNKEYEMWKSYARQMAEKGAVTTDTPTYYGLLQMGATDPEKFKALNLNQYHAVIDDGLLRGLMKDQADMIKGESKVSDKFGAFRTTEQIVEAAMASRGMLVAPTKQVDSPAWNEKVRAMGMLDQRISDIESSTQKKLTDPEKQAVMDKLVIDKKIPGWFGTSIGASTAPGFVGDTSKLPRGVGIGDIPAQTQRDIRARLRAKGKDASDENVVTVYRATYGGSK